MAVLKKEDAPKVKKRFADKYDNRFSVSYSNNMYLRVRNLCTRMGVKIQDFQRAAIAHYVPIAEMELEASRAQNGLKSERTENNEND